MFTTDWDSLQWLWLYKLQRANVTVETIIKENESDIDWFNTEIKDEILDSIREDLKKGKGKSIFKRSDIKNLNYKIGLALLYGDSEERILEDAKHEIIDIDNNNLVNFI